MTNRAIAAVGKSAEEQGEYCVVCGMKAQFRFDPSIVTPQLKEAWHISRELVDAFNRKENLFCSRCGSSLRTRRLCAVLMETFSEISGRSHKSFAELLSDQKFRRIRIAEVNACGALHSFLAQHPNVFYSEYVPHTTPGKIHQGIRREDLQRLTYPSAFFDFILTSETLEHVPDPDAAIQEIYRTMKPSGYHIFTVPVIPSQYRTVQRARLVDGQLECLVEPAYHGRWLDEGMFVNNDFGMDLVERLDGIGFKTNVFYLCPENELDVAVVFRSRKLRNAGARKLLDWITRRV